MQTYQAASLYVMDAGGGGARELTPSLDRSPAAVTWSPDGSGLYFSAEDRGSVNVHFAALRGGVRPVTEGAQLLSLTSLSRGFIGVGVRSDPDEPPDVVRYDVRRPEIQRLTAVNSDVLANKRLAAVEEVWYTSSGGTRVQGWIVKPPGFDPARRYPLIMETHMAGVDTVIGRGYVDTDRMYVGGCSGGEVLSSWVIGHGEGSR